MTVIEIRQTAPDFSLKDINGKTQTLSKYKGRKHIVLVLNRGFM